MGIVLFALVFALQVFLSWPRGTSTGEIRASGSPHGQFLVRPVECYTGGHWGFDGVWVTTEKLTSGNRSGFRGGLKLVRIEGAGLEAFVENPHICVGFKCQQRQVDPRHCRLFDVALRDGDLWLRSSGHAKIECAFPEGGTLEVDVTFDGCAGVPSSGGD